MPDTTRRRFIVTGQVQGVGFRPFVYRIALDNRLTGLVLNTPEGVRIEVQGPARDVDAFGHDLERKLPPLARIVSLTHSDLDVVADEKEFRIEKSTAGEGHQVLISPDTATCPDCLAELNDPADPRHLYPFTNCTNCGPRYTITRSVPYDRPYTTMACFPLCESCAREYGDPLDRRFHAQPNACPVCGPQVWLTDREGNEQARGLEALNGLARALADGRIAAVKGLGGFHLACDALDSAAVAELRRRKNRPAKPLAVMVPDLDAARALAHVAEGEEKLLSGIARPIVLCRARHDSPLSPRVAPDTAWVGIMVPYTPLHHVLLGLYRQAAPDRLPALVMTSGNMSSEPICLGNREALARLAHIADLFLLHNRDILVRTDDSVARVPPGPGSGGDPVFLRRARGYVPGPVFLAGKGPSVMGVGPELKNTLCVTKDDQAFVSQHIGDMENLEALGFFREMAEHLPRILKVAPRALIHDLHPDYLSTRYATEQNELPALALQHHFAHAHAVLAEHKHQGPALCLALDGTGLGDDGAIWGGEALFVDTQTLEHARLGHLARVPLPGGDAAIREPWRTAASFLRSLGELDASPWPWTREHGQAQGLVAQMLDKGINSPLTSSTGRLFDAVSALLGLGNTVSYEGQAAIVLERIQNETIMEPYPAPVLHQQDPVELDTLALFGQALADARAGVAAEAVSRRFHLGLVEGLADMAALLAKRTGVKVVGLSGGVMQNLTLHLELPRALERRGLAPLTHRYLPPNDGCISLGQASWGRARIEQG